MKKKKKFPFRRGDRIRSKITKRVGIVVSNGPAMIGDPYTCKIPGGPLVLETHVHWRVKINGKDCICMDKIEDLEKVR